MNESLYLHIMSAHVANTMPLTSSSLKNSLVDSFSYDELGWKIATQRIETWSVKRR